MNKILLILLCLPSIGFGQCDRQQIVDNYHNVYLGSEVSTPQLGWTGNLCHVGLAHRELRFLDWYRSRGDSDFSDSFPDASEIGGPAPINPPNHVIRRA